MSDVTRRTKAPLKKSLDGAFFDRKDVSKITQGATVSSVGFTIKLKGGETMTIAPDPGGKLSIDKAKTVALVSAAEKYLDALENSREETKETPGIDQPAQSKKLSKAMRISAPLTLADGRRATVRPVGLEVETEGGLSLSIFNSSSAGAPPPVSLAGPAAFLAELFWELVSGGSTGSAGDKPGESGGSGGGGNSSNSGSSSGSGGSGGAGTSSASVTINVENGASPPPTSGAKTAPSSGGGSSGSGNNSGGQNSNPNRSKTNTQIIHMHCAPGATCNVNL